MRPLVLSAIILLQFQFLLTNILLLGLVFSISKVIVVWITLQSFVIKKSTLNKTSLKCYLYRKHLFCHKHYTLETSVPKPKYTTQETQQGSASYCLFKSTKKEVGSIIGDYWWGTWKRRASTRLLEQILIQGLGNVRY